jgi:hypothetical protein
MRDIYMMEYYSAIRKNEVMSFIGIWMELEIMMFSEKSQTLKEENPMLSCIYI